MATYFALGLMPSQTGVSFLDLIQSVEADIKQGSLIFTLGSLGYMIGSMVGGFLLDKFDKELIFGTCALLAGLLTVTVPWCRWVELMITTVFVRSLFTGAMDSGGTVILLTIWGTKANPYMQALHFTFALGGVCSPLLTEPFLMPLPEESSMQNITEIGANISSHGMSVYTEPARWTTLDIRSSTGHVTLANSTDVAALPSPFTVSRVYIPHIFVGGYTFLTSVPFFVIFFMRSGKSYAVTAAGAEAEPSVKTAKRAHSLYFILFGLFFLGYGCTEEVYAAFLMPYVVKYLPLEKGRGAGANSVYWGTFAAGRFIAIFIARFVNVRNMILMDFVLIVVGLVGFLFGANRSDVVIWISDAVIGLGTASVFASSVSWLDQNLTRISGKLAGFIVVCMAVGTMSNMALLGYLFEMVSGQWFVYLILGNTSVSLGIFVLMSFLHYFRGSKHTPQDLHVEMTSPET
ncbi:sodium-dependent glucose transporter 1A-like [Liolophura sinensis]|uniref:sodium-dependent glucose transporter 1A-like n=1 Tax=Liolophura sinensis TaxID=3198878 RepID=UPI003159125A